MNMQVCDDAVRRVVDLANYAASENVLVRTSGMWMNKKTHEFMNDEWVFDEAINIIEAVLMEG